MSRGVGTIVKCWFSECPKNQISDDLGSSPGFPGIIFSNFGAPLRVCESLHILLWLAALKGSPFLCLFLENWKYLTGAPVAEFVAACGVTVLWCFIHSGIHILQSLRDEQKRVSFWTLSRVGLPMGNLFLHLRIVDALYVKSFRCFRHSLISERRRVLRTPPHFLLVKSECHKFQRRFTV